MKKSMFAVVTATMMISSPVFAGDAEAGKAKAVTCAACHGANGISAIPLYPNLAGQKEAYIAQQLRHFKSGERNNAIMKGMVMALSETDMDNLAAYYANMK
jgi:cytochrome c553|tara:strand:- start:597 stop:899 length:303 start_codon:yes stop_codon:yes gene_type:complete